MPTNRLFLDVKQDLKKVDNVVSQIINDRNIWTEFFRDPNGVFIRLGLHPPTTSEINDRTNRSFYAILTNKKLMALVRRIMSDFKVSKQNLRKPQKHYLAGLKKGRIQNLMEFDLQALNHVIKKPEALGPILRLTLYDLAKKGLLAERHSRAQIDSYVTQVIAAIGKRLPMKEIPKLETWDRNYGIVHGFGGLSFEVGPVATVLACVEVVFCATFIASVDGDIFLTGEIRQEFAAKASHGDMQSMRALTTLGALFNFTGELLMHAANFEGGR